MKKIAFFDTKSYDKASFDSVNGVKNNKYEIIYIESKLNYRTAVMAKGCEAVCAFVNDVIDKQTIDTLCDGGTKIIAMRSACYSGAGKNKNCPCACLFAVCSSGTRNGSFAVAQQKNPQSIYPCPRFQLQYCGLYGI